MNTAVQNTAMTFQQFTQEIRAGVQGRFPEADILITPAEKNNGLTLTGLTVREEGRRVTPTIYLNEAYDSYKKGAALAELIAEVADTYRENRLEQEPEIPDFTDFQKNKGYRMLQAGEPGAQPGAAGKDAAQGFPGPCRHLLYPDRNGAGLQCEPYHDGRPYSKMAGGRGHALLPCLCEHGKALPGFRAVHGENPPGFVPRLPVPPRDGHARPAEQWERRCGGDA